MTRHRSSVLAFVVAAVVLGWSCKSHGPSLAVLADHGRAAGVSTAPAADPVIVAAGDIAGCATTGDEATAALLDDIPGTVATLGDNAYSRGTPEEFRKCYARSWGRHRARTRPSAGNHDYGTRGAEGYFRYFGRAAGDPRRGYYSYDLGAWHVIVLNSNSDCVAIDCAAGSAQERWLRADLAAHPNVCTLAYWHHPRFSSALNHGSDSTMTPFWNALYEYGADVVLNGHDHVYERFAPQTPAGIADSVRGIRQFTVGTGGRSHYSFIDLQTNSEAHDGTTFGVLKLTLHAHSYDWEFVPVEGGRFRDSGSGKCH